MSAIATVGICYAVVTAVVVAMAQGILIGGDVQSIEEKYDDRLRLLFTTLVWPAWLLFRFTNLTYRWYCWRWPKRVRVQSLLQPDQGPYRSVRCISCGHALAARPKPEAGK